MKVVVITQARSGSTRLPNKVLKTIKGKSLLQIHVERIKLAKQIDDIYIATTVNADDDAIELLAKNIGVLYSRGSEKDVLDRFYKTILHSRPDYIVRLTSDCPLIDPELLDEIIIEAKKQKLDYYSNILEERYPDGQDIEVFTFDALEKAWKEAKLKSEREHVTPYIRNNSSYNNGSIFLSNNHNLNEDFSSVRLTVDEPEDFEVINQLILNLGLYKSWKEYTEYYLRHPEISSLNSGIIRNEGMLKSLKED